MLKNLFEKFWAKQLANPTGLFGRFFMAAKLNHLNESMNQFTLRELRLHELDQVLEIGFGGGGLLNQMLQVSPSLRATGVDVSQVMLNAALKRFSKAIQQGRLKIVFSNADEPLPFESFAFNKVCTVNTIYFWSDALSVLKECHRVLKSNGVLAICFNPKEELEKWDGHRHGFRLYTLENILSLMKQAGFEEITFAEASDETQGVFYCAKGKKTP